MKAGLSIWSVHRYLLDGRWTQDDFFAYARELGVETVELLTFFWERGGLTVRETEKGLSRHGLKAGCVSASNDFATEDTSRWHKGLEDIAWAIEAAAALGAPVVRIFAGDLHEGVTFASAQNRIIEGLKQAAELAEKRKIALGIENHGRLAGRTEQVKALIAAVGSSWVGSTFDMGNFILVGEDPLGAYAQLAPHVVHVHAKDFAPFDAAEEATAERHIYRGLDGKSYVGVLPGDGLVPLAALVGAMKRDGYRGGIMVEYEGDETTSGAQAAYVRIRDAIDGRMAAR